MIKIRVEEIEGGSIIEGVMVKCPSCGQKLGEVRYLKGVLMLRVKCRRCGRYIDVDGIGNGDAQERNERY